MTDAAKAVFLSYASQDAEGARKICDALRAAGIEVWFDQSELVGGDAWDAKIRKQISECALFVPVISANTQARREGYFRIEWRLAAQRTHAMSDDTTFLLPVVIDETRDADARVPAEFKSVQWTRLADGRAMAAFCARVRKILAADASDLAPGAQPQTPNLVAPPKGLRSRRRFVAVGLTLAAIGALVAWQPWKKTETGSANPKSAPLTVPRSEAQELVAKVWVELERIHLDPPILNAAENLARRAASIDPLNPDAWAAWSQVDSWFGYMQYDATPQRIESARANAEHALRLAPRSFEARLAQAVYLVRAHGEVTLPPNPEQAEALVSELLKEQPDHPRLLLTAAILERNLKHWSETRRLFERLARNPAFEAQALAELGYAEDRAGDLAAAEAAADRSIRIQPYATNLTLKLYLAMTRGDLDAAEATLDRLPTDIVEEDKVVSIAARVEHWRRDPKRMLKRLEPITRDWLSSVDYDGPTALWTGVAHEMAGQTDAAKFQWELGLKLVEQRLESRPSSGALIKWKGVLLALLGQRQESERLLKLASEMKVGSREGPQRDLWVHARILNGQVDAVLDQIEAQPQRNDFSSAIFRLDPFYDSLRASPRFQTLLAKSRPGTAEITPPVTQNVPASAPKPDDKSIAVLAFSDLSPGHDSEYFSDGISEELLNVLAKVPGLKVTARTSAFFFKGKNLPIPEIAQQLGVAYVVEGSVQRAADQVKIAARLTNAGNGFQVWSDSFTRNAKDVFAVEEEIAGLIAKQLSLKLGANTSAARASVNPHAFELYLQARHALHARTMDGCDRAEVWLTEAIRLEPKFARAHALLAEAWGLRDLLENKFPGYTRGRDWPEGRRIIAKAQEALAIDPECADAHTALGTALWWSWQRADAERELQRAIALNPNDADAHRFLGFVLLDDGRMDEALAAQQRAVDLEPLTPVFLDSLGRDLYLAGHVTKALEVFNRVLALAPDYVPTLSHAPHALLDLGRTDEALALARRLPDNNRARQYQIGIFARAGKQAEAEALLARTDGDRARSLLALGHTEEALRCLDADAETAIALHDWLFERCVDPVRADPRFQRFLATIGATEAHARAQAWRAAHPAEKSDPAK